MTVLRSKLKKAKVSQTKLANSIGVSRMCLYEIISGKSNPKLDTIYKIMEYFNDYDLRNYL